MLAALVFFASYLTGFLAWSILRQPAGKAPMDPPDMGDRASGYTVVLGVKEQAAAGITAEPVKPIRNTKWIEAYGMVLQPDSLFRARNGYVSAVSSLKGARAEFSASKKEYGRLKALNENKKNVSDREVEAAAATLASARANVDRARWSLQSVRDEINLEWGTVISGWIFNLAPGYQGLASGRNVLIRVTLPPGKTLPGIASKISVRSPLGRTAFAKFMARSNVTNPRIQGISFIYVSPSYPAGLIAGMNVTALFPSGRSETGFVVPFSAVVWLNGKAWTYVKKTETGFLRVEIPVSTAIDGGYFVSDTFTSGEQVVTRGAEALLSAESQPKTKKGSGD